MTHLLHSEHCGAARVSAAVSGKMRILAYIVLAAVSLVGASFLWDALAADKLFHCSDSCGPIDFVPPFVHNVSGDQYIAPAWIVWILWAALLALALALPAFAVRIASRIRDPRQ